MTGVLISCAGDSDLAKKLYDFLLSAYPSAANTNMISLREDEVTIQKKLGIKNKEVRKSLSDFQSINADLASYSIMEFGDTFTIGVQHSLDEVDDKLPEPSKVITCIRLSIDFHIA